MIVKTKRGRAAVWFALLVLAAAAWGATIFEARSMGGMSGMGDMNGMGGMTPASSTAWSFLAAWVLMMVAMMFPSAAPAVTALTAVNQDRRQRAAPAWVFLVGYLAVWGLVGVGAYLLSVLVPDVRMTGLGLRASSPLVAGLVLIAAGLYQWSPFKRSCLERCRSAMDHFRREAREGAAGAFRSGVAHGAQCVGSSAGLMLVLFAVGLMNLGWMGLLTAAIFAENVVPFGPLAGRLFGAVLAVCGLVLPVAPQLGRLFA